MRYVAEKVNSPVGDEQTHREQTRLGEKIPKRVGFWRATENNRQSVLRCPKKTPRVFFYPRP